MKNTLSLILLLCSFQVFWGQYSQDLEKYSLLYPESQSISLEEHYEIHINIIDGEISITEDQDVETLYLDASAKYMTEDAISYSTFFEVEDLEASVFSFDGKKYRNEKIKDFKVNDNLSGSFYDDIKTINFIYPNLKKGSKSKLKYRTIIKNPRFLKTIYLGSYYPIARKKVTIYADKGIELNFKEFNLDSVSFNFNKTESKKQDIYSWEINEVKEFKFNENAMSYRTKVPHIVPIISRYTTENKAHELLSSEKGLYNWYYSLVKDLNSEEHSPEFKPLVDSLTQNCTTDLEKVKAIYYWTQQNIKYIAFEDGLGGFIPRSANDVFKKKYGDCKDNSSILEVMLKTANLNGHITWVGTRKIPYKYNEVPTPIVDNHMILTYFDKDSTIYYLDATGRYLDLNTPSSFIQGKETLIAFDSLNYLVKTVPVMPADNNSTIDSCFITIDNKSIKGRGTSSYTGYLKTFIFSYLEGKNKKEELEVFYKQELEKGNNNFMINSVTETNKFEYEKPFHIDYLFDIPNYVKSTSNESYINLNFDKSITALKPKEKETEELEHKFKSKRVTYVELEIPENYALEYLPTDLVLNNEKFQCSITYQKQDNKISYNQEIILDFIRLSPEEVIDFRSFVNKIEKSYKEVVVLTKN